jgi:predicted signal transduction protein with EAL and GGDEF domain
LAELAPNETVARIGGDEFAVLQPFTRSPADINRLAESLLDALAMPFEIAGETIQIGGSIGVARAPTDGTDLGALMKCADVALYDAKGAGRGQYRLFDPAAYDRELKRRETERDLRSALLRDEFEVHYQPFIDLKSHETIGFEALVRWRHPRRGLVPPLEFIPLAEQAGLIIELGALVLRKACTEAARWPNEMRIAVNLSPLQLRSPGFALSVLRALKNSGLAPQRLELEITETVLMSDDAATRSVLNDLKQLGVMIAIDDFGTGYSALSYLRAFPIDRLKIDRSFVQDIQEKPDARSIIRAVLGLAHDLGIKTTAEGIETEVQLSWLSEAGCGDAQGFLFSKPQPVSDLAEYFANQQTRRELSWG